MRVYSVYRLTEEFVLLGFFLPLLRLSNAYCSTNFLASRFDPIVFWVENSQAFVSPPSALKIFYSPLLWRYPSTPRLARFIYLNYRFFSSPSSLSFLRPNPSTRTRQRSRKNKGALWVGNMTKKSDPGVQSLGVKQWFNVPRGLEGYVLCDWKREKHMPNKHEGLFNLKIKNLKKKVYLKCFVECLWRIVKRTLLPFIENIFWRKF